MSVREISGDLVAVLAALLKPMGFRKRGAMFSRERDGFIERYLVAGSRWNSGEYPWTFSIEVGVFFPEFPPHANVKGFWRHAHAVGSTHSVLPHTPQQFHVAPESLTQVSAEVAQTILDVSVALPEVVGPARERIKKGLFSPLPVPVTWMQNATQS